MTSPDSTRNGSLRPVLQYAYRLLGYRDRSEKQMSEKLRIRGFGEDEIRKAINHLKANNYLDDKKLAASLKRYALESKHLGLNGTRKFLESRGVPADIINEVLRDINESETAACLVEKKVKKSGDKSAALNVRKMYSTLLRKGYSYETINKTLRHLRITEKAG